MSKAFFTNFLLTFIFVIAPLSAAQAFDPIRDAHKLWEAVTEKVVHVSTARVILADYELIRRDFPEIKNLSNEKIDEWLIRNTAFVSKQQAAQEEVNAKISTDGEERTAYRPREYRRAHVFVADTGGLIDAKGTGSVDPSGGSHDNGLATLGDMIREFLYEKMVKKIFTSVGQFDTVGSYAVIDFGFDIKHPEGGTSRAGTVLRQAHTRYHQGKIGERTRDQSVMLPDELQKKIEFLLRKFGISSSVKFGSEDLVNLQGADTGAVIDFGSFLVHTKFTRNVSFFYDKDGSGVSDKSNIITKPGRKDFVQPSPELQIPFNVWGYSVTGQEDSKYDNPYIWSHELAAALASGQAQRIHAEQHLHNMLDPVDHILKNSIKKCSAILL